VRRVVVMMMALNRLSFTADASNLLVTSKAADDPVEERPFKGCVERARKARPLGLVYRFGILRQKLLHLSHVTPRFTRLG
jgi:hypothetical protein